MTAGLWVPGPLPSMNDLIAAAKGSGGRGIAYATLKRQWTGAIAGLATRAKLPGFPGAATLEFLWSEKRRNRDPDNIAAGGRKLILDGLVTAKVLKGDGWRFVWSWTDKFVVTDGPWKPGVSVIIREAT